MSPIAPPTLTDGVIAVRPLRESDIPAIVDACRDPEIARWTRVPSPYTREDAERFLAIAAAESRAGHGVALAVADAQDRLVGTVALTELDGEGYGEIGYWTAPHARGRGVASRAVALMRDWGRTALGLTAIEILPHRDNRGSQRVAELAGFTPTGRVRSVARMPPGRREGYLVYRFPPPRPAANVPGR
jgi:RimJ/RimL family protein N-acetyltransferase